MSAIIEESRGAGQPSRTHTVTLSEIIIEIIIIHFDGLLACFSMNIYMYVCVYMCVCLCTEDQIICIILYADFSI